MEEGVGAKVGELAGSAILVSVGLGVFVGDGVGVDVSAGVGVGVQVGMEVESSDLQSTSSRVMTQGSFNNAEAFRLSTSAAL